MADFEIIIVMDRSGSMAGREADTEGGLKVFLEQQKDNPGETRVSLYEFDTSFNEVFADIPLAEVPEYRLIPRGGTALLDAVGRTINRTRTRLKELPKGNRPKTIVVILTDGEENSSVEYGLADIRRLIEKRRAKGWEIVFLGADESAITVAASMGITQDMAVHYSADDMTSALGTAGAMLSRGNQSGLYGFTDEERIEVL